MCSRSKKVKSRFKRWWKWQPSEATRQKWWWVMIKKTKIPGVKEAVQNEIHISERFFWILAVIATFTGGIFMMIHSNQQFNDKPIVLVFKTRRILIEEIPFLEMTIGKRNNLKDEFFHRIQGVDEVLEEMVEGKDLIFEGKTWTETQLKDLVILARVFCSPFKRGANWYLNKKPPRLRDAFQFPGFNLNTYKFFENDEELVNKAAPLVIEGTTQCSEIFLACTWNSNKVNCSDLFRDVNTDSGSACSFNAMPSYMSRKHETFTTMMEKVHNNLSKEEVAAWTAWDVDNNDNGMFVQTNITIGERNITIPDSQQKHGQWFGLGFIIKYPKLGKFCRQSDTNEYKMTFSFPSNEPDLRNRGIVIPPNHKVVNRVKPTVIIADPKIISELPEKRGCYFSGEKPLKYYNKYTEENCLKECLIDEIRDVCCCTNFFHPRDPKDGIRICTSLQDEICIKTAETELFTIKRSEQCGTCLPSCNGVSYDILTSMTPYSAEGTPELVNDLAGMEIKDPTSIVTTSMEEATVVVITAEKRLDEVEKLGIMGGVLGLTNNITFMDIAKIFVALFGLIVPIKACLDVVGFLFQRAIQQLRGQGVEGEADLWLELFKLPLTIAQPGNDLKDEDVKVVVDTFSQLPPIVQEFLADYNRQVVAADSFGDISGFQQRPTTTASQILRRRPISALSVMEPPLPPIPTWIDFRNWYRNRHAMQGGNPATNGPIRQDSENNDEKHVNQGCFNALKLRFSGSLGQKVGIADVDISTQVESTPVVKIEAEKEVQSCFTKVRELSFHLRGDSTVRKASNKVAPIALDDMDDDGLPNPAFTETEFQNKVVFVVTPPDSDAPEQVC